MFGRLFLILFALPFAGVGCWAGWSIGGTLHDAARMQDWASTDARIVDAGYHSRSGDESTTYEAYASYRYRVGGAEYSNDRVGIDGGADNIGSYQEDTGRRLEQAARSGARVTVYYDPAAPGDSVLDRDIRWGMVGFRTIFLLVFGIVGFGLLYAAIRGGTSKGSDGQVATAAPWLQKEAWQSPRIRSGSREAMLGAWLFATLWNLISMPLPFLLVDEVLEKGNYPALVGLVFPLVGVGLIVWALRRTLEWRRFGATPVLLDPFPGAIGGHVGGSIDLRLPYRADTAFDVTLTCIRSAVSGSGKNRSRSEKALWQDDQRAMAEPGPDGTRLTFRFDVPDGLVPSEAKRGGESSSLWRLNVSAKLPGIDLDRDYDIPVYPTGARSASLPESGLREARERDRLADEAAVRGLLNFTSGPGGKSMHFPAGRLKGVAFGGVLFGGIFAAAGWFLIAREGAMIMGAVFAAAGLLVMLGMLYSGLNSLTVTLHLGELTALRRVLGMTVSRKSMRSDAIVRLTRKSGLQMQTGGRHLMLYEIQAQDAAGRRMTIAEGMRGESDANAAIRLIARELGLSGVANDADRTGNGPPAADDDVDILAADL